MGKSQSFSKNLPGAKFSVIQSIQEFTYLEKETLGLVPKARGNKADCDFSKDLFPYLLKTKSLYYGATLNGYWRDVGSLDDYIKTNLEALKGKINLPLAKGLLKNGNIIASNAKISRNAKVIKFSYWF